MSQHSHLEWPFVESVSSEGTVVMRLPSGEALVFAISAELVPCYRRLIPAPR